MQIKSQTQAFADVLLEMATADPRVYAVSADMGSRIFPSFMKARPDRYLNFGIAEQGMVGAAAGLALSGLMPFVTTLSVFLSMRALEQVRTDIAYPGLNVKIVATGGGLSYGALGPTHQGLEDLSLMRAVAQMVVMAPADAAETRSALKAAAAYDGPVYIRVGRGPVPMIHAEDEVPGFQIGRAMEMRRGKDVALLATGPILGTALQAAEELACCGIEACVLSFPTVKPLDEAAVLRAANETRGIVTLEDNRLTGGFGSAIAELLGRMRPTALRMIGIPDVYPVVGNPEELYREYRMDVPAVVAAALEMCGASREGVTG
ncbi:MAG: transketolase family protein [candidate division NC10 bacterium]|nr:transketolase family protein [candidate division NC10 bacterium]